MLSAVAEQGYAEPTPIQVQAIPFILSGRDLLGAAQTGTGKTAGFALPMLQLLAGSTNTARHAVRALIIAPTRELAAQVHEDVRNYGKHLSLRSAQVFGGVGMQPQIDALRRGVDILVATPGRLLDHARQRTVDLRSVEILVLDEADRMLDMGFLPDIRRILALLPARRQNLLFSATFPDEIRKLAGTFLRDPAKVEVARRNTPAELVAQRVHAVAKDRKRDLLAYLVSTGDWHQVLVFCKTKRGANRLAEQLERGGIEADAIHGNKSQNARTRALKSFKDGELRVLVATDIAARGLDIEQLPHVVNYDLPHVPEDYVHRIGRTGRAGAAGEAISLVSHDERPLLAAIEKLIGRRIECSEVPGFSSHAEPLPGATPTRKAPDAHPHRTAAGGRKRDAHEGSRKHFQQPKARHQPPKPHHQQPKPHQQHRRSEEPQAQATPVPGYRPLTAHGKASRVPALLNGGKSRTS
ncbi:MAG TPA: DEAD/DEAH box helicase [Burkholderiales bacterium]|nr:DEAD/DEAH box helicase [Burkholderiales bacterium]